MVRFLVIDTPLVYNSILSRPILNALKIVSTYDLLMKFLVTKGVGEIKGDQYEVRKCLAIALPQKNSALGEVQIITMEEQVVNLDLGLPTMSSSDP